jgi:hypothetical protein
MNREQFSKIIFFLRDENIIDNIENIFKGKIPQEELDELKKDIQRKYEQWYDRVPLGNMISPYMWLTLIPKIGIKNRDVLLEYIENMEL